MAVTKRLSYLIFLLFFCLMVLQIITGSLTFHLVLSNSMAPAFYTGDLVTIETNYEELSIGDVILYRVEKLNIIVIHRIFDIHDENGTLYFAVKGDANKQPDFIEEQEGVINKKVEIEFDNNGEKFYLNATVTYYSDNYIIGKVIDRIPVIGWIFVPFFSYWRPFTLIAVLIMVGLLFYRLFQLNSHINNSFDRLFLTFRDKGVIILSKDRSTLNFLFYLILMGLFSGFFLLSLSITGNVVQTIQLEEDGFSGVDSSTVLNASYKETYTRYESLFYTVNSSTISIQLYNSSETFKQLQMSTTINYSINNPDNVAEGVEYRYFALTLDEDNFVIDSTDDGKLMLHTLPVYVISAGKYSNQPGFLAGGYFFDAEITNYTHSGIEYHVLVLRGTYDFIQDLIVYSGQSTYYYDLNTGFLIFSESTLKLVPWITPDITILILTILFAVSFYHLSKKRKINALKVKFDEMIGEIVTVPESYITLDEIIEDDDQEKDDENYPY
ncbi:MAG: signal peptidase I [Candidatus Hodarchaeales archaeon]